MISLLSDNQIIERIAKSCTNKRIALKMTKKELAKRANISYLALWKFEAGNSPRLKTILSVFRALGEIERLENLIIEQNESPKNIFEREMKSTRKGK